MERTTMMDTMMNESRKKIDEVDGKLLILLAERLKICKELGEYKKKHHLPLQSKEREKQVIRDRSKNFKELGFDDHHFVQQLFELIMKKAREVQK